MVKTLEVVVSNKLLDVSERIFQTLGIIYVQLGVSSVDLSSVIYDIFTISQAIQK